MKKIVLFALLVASVAVFQFCSSSKKAASDTSKISYTRNVQPVIQANCSPCHIPPQGRARALNTFDAAKKNIDTILIAVNKNPEEKGFMPMRHPKLPDSTISIFARWKETGLAEN